LGFLLLTSVFWCFLHILHQRWMHRTLHTFHFLGLIMWNSVTRHLFWHLPPTGWCSALVVSLLCTCMYCILHTIAHCLLHPEVLLLEVTSCSLLASSSPSVNWRGKDAQNDFSSRDKPGEYVNNLVKVLLSTNTQLRLVWVTGHSYAEITMCPKGEFVWMDHLQYSSAVKERSVFHHCSCQPLSHEGVRYQICRSHMLKVSCQFMNLVTQQSPSKVRVNFNILGALES
jgi:hypothetical protein